MLQLSDVTVTVNDDVILVIPNSVSFQDGLGNANVRAGSVGEGNVELIVSRDIETKIGMVKFSVPATPDDIDRIREWQDKLNTNIIGLSGSTEDGKSFTRTFNQGTISEMPEINIGAEGDIEVEFKTATSIG